MLGQKLSMLLIATLSAFADSFFRKYEFRLMSPQAPFQTCEEVAPSGEDLVVQNLDVKILTKVEIINQKKQTK